MHIPQFMGKLLLKKNGFQIPKGVLISSLHEISTETKNLNFPVLLNPFQPYKVCAHEQIEYKVQSYKEAIELSEYFFRHYTGKEVVSRIYFEELIPSSCGYRLTIQFNLEGCPVISVYRSAEIIPTVEWTVNYLQGLPLREAVELWEEVDIEESYLPLLAVFTEQCYTLFVSLQLLYLDIFDFYVHKNQHVIVKSLTINVDDYVLENKSQLLEDIQYYLPQRLMTPAEKAVAEINKLERSKGYIRYFELADKDSGVAVCFAGTGFSLMMMDFLYENQIIPVNMTDLSSGVSEKKLVVLLRSILNNEYVKSLIMVINFFQFSRVDVYASALVIVLKELSIDPLEFPVIVRLVGPGSEGVSEILKSVPGIHFFEEELPFEQIKSLINRDGVQERREIL